MIKIKNKKLKFTFVYPDFEYSITKNGANIIKGGWYSEGIAQLASIIENLGWNVDLIHLTEPIQKESFIRLLKKSNPDIIGFSVRTGVWRKAKEMIKYASNLKKFVIVGSYHPTLWPDEVIQWKGVNAICIGEGEQPVIKLIKNYKNSNKLRKIESLWVKEKNGKIYKNKIHPLIEDLNTLPLPKFEIFDFSKLLSSKIKTATVVLTRGCPYNCTYCWNNYARSLYPNKHKYVRFRNPNNCINYINKVLKVYPEILTFRFQDDLWPFHNDWFDKFSKLYIEGIKIRFECHLRADLLNDKIIKTLKRMGCFGIYFGVESGNDYIRNKILKRNMSKESLLNAFKTCKKYKIKTHAYNIVGIPHENMRKVLDTIKLNAKLEPTDMFYFIFFPYAGTELSNIAIESKFYDPRKPLDPIINIEMPDFKGNQIRFANLYGRVFTRIYQIIYKLPRFISKILEKIIDLIWLFPYYPFKILNSLMIFYRKIEEKVKIIIKKHFFGLYIILKR